MLILKNVLQDLIKLNSDSSIFKEQGEIHDLFHPTTLWKQISHWLKSISDEIKSPVDEFIFIENEQKTIVDENQPISSSINSTAPSTTFDGINRDNTTQVSLSFELYNQTIRALKSLPLYRLLLNKYLMQQLHINVPRNQIVLTLENANRQILTNDDMQKGLNEYSTNDNQPICIRISLLIQIVKYDDEQLLEVPVSYQNATVEQLLQLTTMPTDIYKYLASNAKKSVISNLEYISKLNETKFLLAKESETCLVSVKLADELQLIEIDDETNRTQRFVISATIADIYKCNEIDATQQFLLYSNDFVPAHSISLVSFLPTSHIRFTVIGQNLPVFITVINDGHSMKFHCSREIQVKRLLEIACQLFNIKPNYYRLTHLDSLLDDEDMSLDDIDSSMTDAELILVCNATLNASLKYLNQTIMLPCAHETQLADIVQTALTKLHIPQESIDMYELFVLDENETQVELDMVMEDVAGLFSADTTLIPLELKKKADN